MAVGINVGSVLSLLGEASFVEAFFSTIAGNLEPQGWGTRFPVTMRGLYQGEVAAAEVPELRSELRTVRAELRDLPPDRVIWDVRDRALRPPWGDDIADTITDLGNYFVTMNGEDLFDVVDELLEYAESSRKSARLKPLGPV